MLIVKYVEVKPFQYKKVIVEENEVDINKDRQKKLKLRKDIQDLTPDGLDALDLIADLSNALNDLISLPIISNELSKNKSNGTSNIAKFQQRFEVIGEIVEKYK